MDLPLKNKSFQEMQGSFHSLQPCGKRKQGIKVLYCHVPEILLKGLLIGLSYPQQKNNQPQATKKDP